MNKMPMCGGLGDSKPATPEVQEICDKVKEEFFQKSGKNCTVYEAIEYKTQCVAGTNFFVKVRLGGQEFAHLRIFKCLPHAGETLTLSSYQVDKAKKDDIVHF
ncbi:cystatin-A-like [Discoglossus pictus]